MADDLMIEVTGSASKAETALDGVRIKLDNLLISFDKLTPSVSAFVKKFNEMASTSKAIASLKGLTENTDRQAMSVKDAESRMAMYQARLDRATVSMNKSAVASAKLAAEQKKLKEVASIDAANKAFLDNFKFKGFPNEPSSPTVPDLDTPDIPTPPLDSARLASERGSTSKSTSFSVDTAQAMNAVAKTRAYIDSLTPAISRMSGKAQGEFNSLTSELMRVSSQIDNQRGLYSQLASAATKAANATGEGSQKYLQLEKRMLSTDAAIDKLISKQEKLKDQMPEPVSGWSKDFP